VNLLSVMMMMMMMNTPHGAPENTSHKIKERKKPFHVTKQKQHL
jgi:hypothetical protein